MAGYDDGGWADLRADQLDEIDGEEFEDFCFDLVCMELYHRHDSPPPPDGPAGKSVPDGGRDILVTITKPAKTSKADYQTQYGLHPLTEDHLEPGPSTRTAYSCKSGENWLNLALRDATERSERTIEVLCEGGYFKLLINQTATLDATVKRGKKGAEEENLPHVHLVKALWKRMKEQDANASDPSARIEIIEAGTLAAYLRARQPPGGTMDRWLRRLSLTPILRSMEEWRAAHAAERQEPLFIEDPARTTLRAGLVEFANAVPSNSNPEQRMACLIGPPGVGKTRVTLHTLLGRREVADRVRVALSPDEARTALDGGRLFRRHKDVFLIVDDCLRGEADRIAARFRAALSATSGASAHLLMLVPVAEDAAELSRIPHIWRLQPLDQGAVRLVVANEMGRSIDDETVVDMAALSEGFPLFARLLATEAKEAGRPPRDMPEAVRWALASVREANTERELEELRLRRARCLLAASLTRRIDWDALAAIERADVARAVGLERWEQVIDTARECLDRGILRNRLGWRFKYVTPQVLEREIITWLLGEGGPDRGGRGLAEHGTPYLEDFFETLGRLGLPKSVIDGIATVALGDLASAADWADLAEVGLLGARLLFVARHLPEATARELRRRIAATELEELQGRVGIRRGLVFALEELLTRRNALSDSEDALFLLAQAENESYANNASSTWANIFMVERNMVHASLRKRVDILERRLAEPNPRARRVALAGAHTALVNRGFRRSFEPLDGNWPVSSSENASHERLRIWRLVVQRLGDVSLEVAAFAKNIVIGELRAAVRGRVGPDVIDLVASHISLFSDEDRIKLREKLEEVRAYDRRWLESRSPQLNRLEGLLRPTSFHDKLQQRVATWGPASLRKDDGVLDDTVAREGLANDLPILAELDWLMSDAAQRAHVFAFALGRCDEQVRLLEELRSRAARPAATWRARVLAARYLAGHAEVGRRERAIEALRDMQANPAEADTAALATVELGASPESVVWLEQAICADSLSPGVVTELGRTRHWLDQIGDDVAASLFAALVGCASPVGPAAALELMVDFERDRPATADILSPLLLRALVRLPQERVRGMTDHYWEIAATRLVSRGEGARIAQLAVRAIASGEGANDYAWNALHAAIERDASSAWRAIAEVLERRDPDAGRLLIAFQFHRRNMSWPCDDVLAWVGTDQQRGRAVVSVVRPYGATLDPILRGLISRFGGRSSVARFISARIHSTDGAVSSLAQYDAAQLSHARQWLSDPDVDIQTFARDLVSSLERSFEANSALEEDERRSET